MSEGPVELVVAAFQDETGADHVLKGLEEAKKERAIGIQNAAVIRRDAENKLHIHETADWSGGKGAVAGALIGGAIGILFPPSILVTGALGATIAGLAANLSDCGFPEAQIKELGTFLMPGTSAIIAVVEHESVADLERKFVEHGAKTVHEPIRAEVITKLEQGRDILHTAAVQDKPEMQDTTGTVTTTVPKLNS